MCNISVGQLQNVSKILSGIKDEKTKKSANIFSSYLTYSGVENQQLPEHVTYTLTDSNWKTIKDHQITQKAKAMNLMEEYNNYCNIPELPKPALKGYFYNPVSVVAKELSGMLPSLQQKMESKINSIEVYLLHGMDGISIGKQFNCR